MPKVDFSKVDDSGFSPIPDGTYLCDVESVEATTTAKGDEMWKLTWLIVQGEHEGRKFWDNFVFNSGGYGHVKIACKAMGFDVSKEMDLNHTDLIGKTAKVNVITQDYIAKDGSKKTASKVPYDGYSEPSDQEVIGF